MTLAIQPSRFKVFADTTKHLLTTLDGLYYLAELVGSILEVLRDTFKNAPSSLKNLKVSVDGFIGFSTAFDFVSQLHEWIFPEKTPSSLAGEVQSYLSKSVDTFKSVLDFVAYLEDLECFQLLKRVPGIDLAMHLITLASTGLSVWGEARQLAQFPQKNQKIQRKLGEWESIQRDGFENIAAIYNSKSELLQIKKEAFPRYCQLKIERWKTAKINARNDKIKSAFNVACLVAYVVGIVFTLLAIPQLALPLLVFFSVINAAYLVQTLMSIILLKKETPQLTA